MRMRNEKKENKKKIEKIRESERMRNERKCKNEKIRK